MISPDIRTLRHESLNPAILNAQTLSESTNIKYKAFNKIPTLYPGFLNGIMLELLVASKDC